MSCECPMQVWIFLLIDLLYKWSVRARNKNPSILILAVLILGKFWAGTCPLISSSCTSNPCLAHTHMGLYLHLFYLHLSQEVKIVIRAKYTFTRLLVYVGQDFVDKDLCRTVKASCILEEECNILTWLINFEMYASWSIPWGDS